MTFKGYLFLFLMMPIITFAQQRITPLTQRQKKILMIQQGTNFTFNEAETVLKQQETGLLLCAGGAVTLGTTAAIWAFLEHNEQILTPSGAEVLNCCCRSCAFTTYVLCSLGCCEVCDC